MRLNKKTTIALTDLYSVTIDAEDEQRIREHQWKVFEGSEMIPFSRINGIEIPLANFLLGLPVTKYVAKKDGPLSRDFRKAKLIAN